MILFEIKAFEIFVDLDNFAGDIRWKKCGKQSNIRWKKCGKPSIIRWKKCGKAQKKNW